MESSTTPPFGLVVAQFQQTLNGVREVVDEIADPVAALDAADFGTELNVSVPDELLEALKALLALRSEFPTTADMEALRKDERLQHANEKLLSVFGGDFEHVQSFFHALNVALARPKRTAILFESLLTVAVSTFETLLGGIAAQHFRSHPDAVSASEKEFSLADLESFGNVDDARTAAIEARVDKLMRESLDAWDAWFNKLLKTSLRDLADYDNLHEILQRRHAVVHNAGRVSRQYYNTVKDARPIGTELTVDRAYLDNALDELSIVGNRLVVLAWTKWVKHERGVAGGQLLDYVYNMMLERRWRVVECLCSTGIDLPVRQSLVHRLRTNGWLATKRLYGTDRIMPELAEWDTSALEPVFRIAKAALSDNFDALFQQLNSVDRSVLTEHAIDHWPIFEEARDDPRYTLVRLRFSREDEKPSVAQDRDEAQDASGYESGRDAEDT